MKFDKTRHDVWKGQILEWFQPGHVACRSAAFKICQNKRIFSLHQGLDSKLKYEFTVTPPNKTATTFMSVWRPR